MLGLILLATAPLLLGGLLINSLLDDDEPEAQVVDDPSEPDEPPIVSNEDIYIEFGDEPVVEGTDGVDLLFLDFEDPPVRGRTVLLGDGDDVAVLTPGADDPPQERPLTQFVTVRGGDGDDRIENRVFQGQIYGDDGDDWLEGGGDTLVISGGAGDDLIVRDSRFELEFGSIIDGGDGDDTIVLSVQMERFWGESGPVSVRTGEGDDEILLRVFKNNTNPPPFEPGETFEPPQLVRIEDFERGSDQLVVLVDSFVNVSSFSVEPGPTLDNGVPSVKLLYVTPEVEANPARFRAGQPEVRGEILVRGVTDLTEDDVRFEILRSEPSDLPVEKRLTVPTQLF